MFDLESELSNWREQMRASGLGSAEVIRELEEHLREDIDCHLRNGATQAAAFYGACERLGKPVELTREFEIAHRESIARQWRRYGKMTGICVALGLAIASLTQVLRPKPYVSDAKVLVRSTLESVRTDPESPVFPITVPEGNPITIHGSAAMASLVSETLFEDVARAIGPSTVLKKVGGGGDLAQAAAVIRNGFFWVGREPGTSALRLSFRHPDAEVIELVLSEFIARLRPANAKSTRFASINAPERGRITARVSDVMAPLASDTLFQDVATEVGPGVLLNQFGGGEDLVRAAAVIRSGLWAKSSQGSSIIHLGFRHPDASVVQPVLRKVIARLNALSPEFMAESLRIAPDGVSLSSTPIASVSPILLPSIPRFDSELMYRQMASTLSVGFMLGLFAALILILRAHRVEKHARLD